MNISRNKLAYIFNIYNKTSGKPTEKYAYRSYKPLIQIYAIACFSANPSDFDTVKKVKSAKIKVLIEVVGKASAEKVIRYFREK